MHFLDFTYRSQPRVLNLQDTQEVLHYMGYTGMWDPVSSRFGLK